MNPTLRRHKTYEEMFGIERANAIKEKQRQFNLLHGIRPPNMKGKKLSTEARMHISLGKIGKRRPDMLGNSLRKGVSSWNKGTKGMQKAWNKGKPCLRWIGKNNPRWKGGITELRHKIRTSPEYRNWSQRIKERDNYTCQMCEEKGGVLETNHLVRFADIIVESRIKTFHDALALSFLWDIKNGITLCKKCHKLTIGKENQFRRLFYANLVKRGFIEGNADYILFHVH